MSKKKKSIPMKPLYDETQSEAPAVDTPVTESTPPLSSENLVIAPADGGDEWETAPQKKAPRFVRLRAALGESRSAKFFTVLNIVMFGAWIVTYIICVICRDAMLSSAAMQQAAQGITNFRLEITSPMFTVLTVVLYLLPLTSILWAMVVKRADKKGKIICDRKIMIVAVCIIIVAAAVAVFDVSTAHMLF